MLPQRQALISKFGPTPSQLVMSVARPPLLLPCCSHRPQVPPRPGPLAAIHRLCVLAAMFAARAPLMVHSPGDFFPPIFNCPHEMDRLGALGDGGKWLCGISRIQDKPDCVVYSFGTSLFPPCPARASLPSGCPRSTPLSMERVVPAPPSHVACAAPPSHPRRERPDVRRAILTHFAHGAARPRPSRRTGRCALGRRRRRASLQSFERPPRPAAHMTPPPSPASACYL